MRAPDPRLPGLMRQERIARAARARAVRRSRDTASGAEVVALAAHELRAPLAVVTGYLDMIAGPLPPESVRKAAEAARTDASRMAALLDDLLAVADPAALVAPSAFAALALADIAEEVLQAVAVAVPGHEVRVEAACRGRVRGDARRLRQATLNLVANALRHAPGGEVVVRVECGGGEARLIVDDSGPGVPPSERDRVFERYARGGGAAVSTGLGLGLWVVKQVAEGHGGSARVEDAPGGGARFVLALPHHEAETD